MKAWLSPAILAAMLCLAALAVFCERAAYAGEWVISYERDGAVTQDPSNSDDAHAYALKSPADEYQLTPTNSCGGSVSASYRAIATWQGEDWGGWDC